MRRLLPFVAAFLIASAAQPALASIIPIDPIIGVRGKESGSEPSTSNAFFTMGACEGDLNEAFNDVFCLEYDILQSVSAITSLTFQFRDGSNELIPHTLIFLDESSFNGFDELFKLDDGFSVQFRFNEGGALQCPVGFEGEFPIFDDCGQGSTIELYLYIPDGEDVNAPYSASLRAVNDITVPEPGLLILLGTGLVLAGRRLRRRRAA
jgi:PEP-CTERM motif